jgi:hypothetical protein
MNLYGALRDARGSGARISSIRSGAVMGSLAPLGGMRSPLCRTFAGPVYGWMEAAAAWRRKVGAPLFWWLRMGEPAAAARPLGSQEARRVGSRRGLSL